MGLSIVIIERWYDLTVQMIVEGLLSVEEADAIKNDWATNHRFRLTIASLGDLF